MDTLPPYNEPDLQEIQTDRERNNKIIEKIAKCEQASDRHVSMVRDIKIQDPRSFNEVAKITLAASVLRPSQSPEHQNTPIRIMMDFHDEKITIAALIKLAEVEPQEEDGQSRVPSAGAASIGIQVDLPVPTLYGEREPGV